MREQAGRPLGPEASSWAFESDPGDEPRQAVVFIHGLGDQPPMRTLRSFTWGLGLRRLFSSPDRVTDSTELRRLSEPPTKHRQAHTDYFELYWAHLTPDGSWLASVAWSLRLLLRRSWWSRGGAAARLVIAFQLVLAAFVAFIGWGVLDAIVSGGLPGLAELVATWQAWIAAALAVGALTLGRFLRVYLSDAVRYLVPRPANIESRRRIREEGLMLLRRLHAGRYRRIVVVGHSLGSVIGLDLLRSLWDELRHPDPRLAGDQGHLDDFDEAADRLDPGGPAGECHPGDRADGRVAGHDALAPGVHRSRPVTAAQMDDFQAAQFALWTSGRSDGVPWLVTDFVSLASPLAFAPLLLDEPDVGFDGRPGSTLADQQSLKEIPRCPPIHDELQDSRFYPREYGAAGLQRRLRVGHTAAPFGPTRWTNVYQPAGAILHGDLLAGPISAHFGPGVRDVPVACERGGPWGWLRARFPLAHVSYWWAPGGGPAQMPAPVPLPSASGDREPTPPGALEALISALRLDDITASPPSRPAA